MVESESQNELLKRGAAGSRQSKYYYQKLSLTCGAVRILTSGCNGYNATFALERVKSSVSAGAAPSEQ